MAQEEVGLKVAIRIRPLKATEGRCAWKCDDGDGTVQLLGPDGEALTDKKSSFRYDAVFDEHAATSEIYDAVVRELVDGVLKGVNGTVFAYGQTAAGKTYTMQGGGVGDGGVMTMAAEQIFGQLALSAEDTEFLLRCSYLEVYNETVRDLLGDGEVAIREDAKRGVFVEGAQEEIVTDVASVQAVLARGERARHVGATQMNERSSRSHTVFRLVVESKKHKDDGVLVGNLSLVDLAGSESVRLTGAMGQRAKEGGKINQSLLTLSMVIKQLGDRQAAGNAAAFVNFRDSKLTRMLQPTLCGDARLAMVCCVAPAECYVEETRSTLQFGARAAQVKLAPKIHEVLDDASQLRRVKRQLAELMQRQAELEQLAQLGNSGKTEELSKLLEQNLQLSSAVQGKAAEAELQASKIEKLTQIEKLMQMIVLGGTVAPVAGGDDEHITKRRTKRSRETWAPGAGHSHAAAAPLRFGAQAMLAEGSDDDGDDAAAPVEAPRAAEAPRIAPIPSFRFAAPSPKAARAPDAAVAERHAAELREAHEARDELKALLDGERASLDGERAINGELRASLDSERAAAEAEAARADAASALAGAEAVRADRLAAGTAQVVALLRAQCAVMDEDMAKRGVSNHEGLPFGNDDDADAALAWVAAADARRCLVSAALDAATEEKETAERDAYRSKQEGVDLREASESFEAQMAELEDEVEQARGAAEEAQAALARAAAQEASPDARDAAAASAARLQAADAEARELRERGRALEAQVRGLEDRISAAKADLAGKDARIERLEQVKMTTDIFRKIQQMQVEKARTEGENAELREQLRCLEAELSAGDGDSPRHSLDARPDGANDSPLRAACAALGRGHSAPASVAARLQLDELAARNAELSVQLDDVSDALAQERSSAAAVSAQLDALGGGDRGLPLAQRLGAVAQQLVAKLRLADDELRAADDRANAHGADFQRLEDGCRAAEARASAAEARAAGAERSQRAAQTPAGRRAAADTAGLQEKIEFLEGENLQLMLEIKEITRASARARADATALRDRLEMLQPSSARPPASVRPPARSALKALPTPKIAPDKENLSNRLSAVIGDDQRGDEREEQPPECPVS
ncbi:P-loop containing nucleoside triphosphate hydrolase protein [Pelagophyceae sp. CCMP2097]|nr:P-loop containing nucleoside triphosphate hydrolase protein [Pelagophyceae sp. CCMP2097]